MGRVEPENRQVAQQVHRVHAPARVDPLVVAVVVERDVSADNGLEHVDGEHDVSARGEREQPLREDVQLRLRHEQPHADGPLPALQDVREAVQTVYATRERTREKGREGEDESGARVSLVVDVYGVSGEKRTNRAGA